MGFMSLVCSLLAYLHTNQSIRIKWGNYISKYIRVPYGVKQEGILSPELFTIYTDAMFENVKDSGLGCYIGNIFTGGLGFADDGVLISPTLPPMKEMFNICEAFGQKYNVMFNPEKYQLLHLPGNLIAGLWHNNKCAPYYVHLGRMIGANTKATVIDQALYTFNVALYSIPNTFQHACAL